MKTARRIAWASAALFAGLLLAAVLLLVWVSRTPSGANWVLGQVPGLTIEGQRGSLHGGPFEAARLRLLAGGREITVEGLSWRDLEWTWRPPGGAWVALHVVEPRARRVVVGPAPPSTAAAGAPQSLRLPVHARIDGLLIDRLELDGGVPLTGVTADLHLGAEAGSQHRISRLQLDRDGVRASATGSIAADAPFALQAEAQIAPRPADGAPAWQATLGASGPLARAQLQGAFSGGPDQRAKFDAQATVAPFEPWPLAALTASTQDLDLSILAPGWPRTRLEGRAEVQSSGLAQPLRADVRMRNAEPGRWDDGRLPVETVHAALQSRADQRDKLDFQLLAMTLVGGGSVNGAGRWEGHRLDATVELEGVQPRALDSRLAGLRQLRGPIEVAAQGLPSPTGGPTPEQTTVTGHVDLQGQLNDGRPVAAQARLRAERDAAQWRVELPQALLRSGGASAKGEAAFTRAHADGAWTATSRGELAAFDPALWWPALKAARADGHRLNGRWALDLAGPQAAGADALGVLRALRGGASVDLAASRLAGVPLTGRAKLVAGRDATLAATLSAAGNNAQIDARLGGSSSGNERWQAEIQAPTLAALAPIASLHPALARWWPRSGSLQGDLSAQGRWPALATSGQAQVRGLVAGTTQVERADLRWQLSSTQPDAPLSLDIDAAGLVHDGQRIDTLKADGQGTLRAHRITLDAQSAALRPPAWVEQVQPGAAGSTGTALRLQASGAWQPAREGGGRWQGRIAELLLRERGTQRAPWLAARELNAAVQFNAAGALSALNADPGRVELLGAALRWRELAWQPGQRVALDADLEPLAVAPFLARLQPEWGWGGDLTVTGRFVARQSSADGVSADFVLERRAGDLQLTDDLGLTQNLGLTDLRLGLVAQGGTWHFTQAVAGANLGVLAGAQSLRVARDTLWPPPETPLEGVLEWRVDNLGVWAPFAPPGWRLGGQLHTSATIGGRFGAPEYTGRVVGSGLAARNLLEGIDVRDGDLAISLRGPDARIEQARFKGGDGELRLTGGASFGAQPRAQLQLVAERFQLLGRFDRRIVTSGRADVVLTRETLSADGRFEVDEGLIDFSRADAPRLDSDVAVIRRGAAASAPVAADPRPPTARAGPLAQADVKVELDLGEKLRVRGRGLDALLRGRLAITTPGGRLAVNGSVRAEEGTYAAYGQKLEIERGILRFAGDVATPRLDIVAARPNLDVRVGVIVSGTAANPRVRLYSEPEMSDLDKLSWLVLGRGPDGLGRTDTALLQRAALALLAGEGPGPTDKVLAQLGLDELSLRQTENGDVRDTVITLGKQLSRRWYLGYERGVNSTTGTWQLIYRIAQRFTLRAQSGSENSLDLIWTWRWDEPRRREPGARQRGTRNGTPPQ
jgi:translocation and assembly module TamB